MTSMVIDIKKRFMEWMESDGEIDFDIHAQDASEWAWLAELIPGIIVYSAGGVLPFQAEGLLHGLPFYYRERHGVASLHVGPADGEVPYLLDMSLYSSSMEVPEFDTSFENFVKRMLVLVPKLEKSPFLYRFPCKKLKFLNDKKWVYEVTDEEDTVTGWGSTPEEAYEYAKQPSVYLQELGFSFEAQNQAFIDRQVSPVPVEQDDRVYPDPEPVFKVNLP